MIVTCPACSSRYKLDESKVTGRGAKITCPKCKHVFVVYPGGTTGPLPESVAKVEEPRSAATNLATSMAAALQNGAPADSEWDDEPTRIGMQKPPDLRRPANPTLALPYEPPPVFQISADEAAARSPTLDFKKVGVSTWKVKIKIGLIYDFSDIKTLRKYIQDGRVTHADVISYDGKLWKPLGEIADLDIFFVQTWEELNRALPRDAATGEHVAPAPKKPVEDPTPARPAPAGPTTTPFRDPFATQPVQKKATAAPKKVVAADNTMTYAIGAVVVIALAAGGWYFLAGPGAAVAPPPPPVAVKPAGPSSQDIAADIKSKLQPVTSGVNDAPVVEAPPDPNADENNDGIPDGAVAVKRPGIPPGATPVGPPTTNTQPQRPPVQPTTNQGPSEITAADAAAAGDSSARSGDWAGAVSAYQQAVSKEPGNSSYLKKLGEAQYKSGDLDGARVSLTQAAKKGQATAWRTLGDVCKDQGDTACASDSWQQYLKTNPKDAADINAKIQSLGG